jgi:enoyl-CoA hydratase
MTDAFSEPPLIVRRAESSSQILRITLNRPRALNAMNWELLAQLNQAIAEAERDQSIRCLLIDGAGERAFSAGADLRVVADLTLEGAREWIRLGHRVFNRLIAHPVPSIAAIHGFALGGGLELALACDLRVAGESAQIGLPEVRRGWFPGWGGARRVRSLIGPAQSRRLALLGEPVDATSALEIGLIHRVVPDGELTTAALGWAEQLTTLPPAVSRELTRQLTTPELIIPPEEIEIDARLFADRVGQLGFREGVLKFLSRKKT